METLNMYEDRRIIALTRFCNILREAAMWILFAILFIVIVNVIMRRIFNAPIFGITEIIKYTMLASAAFALAENEWVEGNISMHLIPEKLTELGRARLYAIMNFVLGILIAYVTYLMFLQSYAHMGTYNATLELKIPMWLPELILVIGVGTMAFVVLAKAVLWTWMSIHRQYISFVQVGLRQLKDHAVTEADAPIDQIESKGVN